MDRVMEICEKYGLTLIEDCAHACGVKWRGRQLGYHGKVSTAAVFVGTVQMSDGWDNDADKPANQPTDQPNNQPTINSTIVLPPELSTVVLIVVVVLFVYIYQYFLLVLWRDIESSAPLSWFIGWVLSSRIQTVFSCTFSQ